MTVTGLLRLPESRSWFTPADEAAKNLWFDMDLPAMAAADHLTGVMPFYVDADASPVPGGLPAGGQTDAHLPNDHLQYALTWYGLAAVAMVYYGLFVLRWRKERKRVTPYRNLHERFARLGAVREALAMLHWDAATNMPDGGAPARGEQLATLKVIVHDGLTDPALPDLLDGAEGQNDLDVWQRANVAEMRRGVAHARAVPPDLVAAFSKACSECEMIWRKARPAGDFATVLPALSKVLALTRQVAAAKAAALGKSPYDALLDEYEPDGSTATVDRLFGELAAALPGMIDDALARQASAARALAAARPVRDCGAAHARNRIDEAAGLRFRAWKARHQRPSLHRRHAGRCPHHHAL